MTSEVTQTAGVAREGPSVRPLQLCVCRLCECLQHFLGWCGWREQGFGLTLSHKLSPHARTHSKAESGGRGFTERLPLQSTAQGPTPHQLPRLRLPDPDDRTERESQCDQKGRVENRRRVNNFWAYLLELCIFINKFLPQNRQMAPKSPFLVTLERAHSGLRLLSPPIKDLIIMLLLFLWQQQTRSRRKHKDESFPLFLFLATFI